MYRIIKPRGGGKTTEIMHLAEEHDAIIVCPDSKVYDKLAKDRGFNDNLKFVNYSDYLNN